MSSDNFKTMYKQGFTLDEVRKTAEALGIDLSKTDYSTEQLQHGMTHELEHAGLTKKEARKTAQIAIDHLKEDPDYYAKLSKIEKAIGIPMEGDIEHEYVYNTGYYNIRDFWWVDKLGNYWKYTNAPVGHKDYDFRFGDPLISPAQPIPGVHIGYFTEEGYKRHQSLAPEFVPTRNEAYDPINPHNIWFEFIQVENLARYVYLDKDIRENLDLWVQYQLRIADAALLRYRAKANSLFVAEYPKDRVIGVILMLIDQGYFLPEYLLNLKVADLSLLDNTVKLGGKKVSCDIPILDFFTSLLAGRSKDEPLFVYNTKVAIEPINYNYIYSVLSALNMDPCYLLAWHANVLFSRSLNKESIKSIPLQEALSAAYMEVQQVLGLSCESSTLIDHGVLSTLTTNYEESLADTQKSLGFVDQDDYGVPFIASDLVEKSTDELDFSIWLHATPMHDISKEEMDAVNEIVSTLSETETPDNQDANSGKEDDNSKPRGASYKAEDAGAGGGIV